VEIRYGGFHPFLLSILSYLLSFSLAVFERKYFLFPFLIAIIIINYFKKLFRSILAKNETPSKPCVSRPQRGL
jgi:hypothetical protein